MKYQPSHLIHEKKHTLPHPNRNKRLLPRHQNHHWCDGCDMAFVGNGQRCPVCNHLATFVRMKKTPPMLEDWEDD